MSYSVFPEVFLLICGTVVYVLLSAGRKTQKAFRPLCAAALFLYSAGLLWMALGARIGGEIRYLNLAPFYSYRQVLKEYNTFDVFEQILDNVLVFVPLGMLFPAAFALRQRAKSYAAVLLFGVCFSLVIEALQYAFSIGFSELDDVISNTIGTAIGCGIFAFSSKAERKNGALTLQKGWTRGLLPAFLFTLAVWAAWCYREYILYRQ